jgi:hypothetical protein
VTRKRAIRRTLLSVVLMLGTALTTASALPSSGDPPDGDLRQRRPLGFHLTSSPEVTRARLPSWTTGTVPLLAPSSRSDLDSLVAILESHAAYSPRYAHMVEGVLQIIMVVQAPSLAEYHRRARSLPVTVVTSRTAWGTQKTFVHNSGHTFTLTIADKPQPRGAQRDGDAEGTHAMAIAAVESLGGDAHSTNCEYTDEDNVYWYGECATVEELESAAALLVSLEAEAYAAIAFGEATHVDNCQEIIAGLEPFEPVPLECDGINTLLQLSGPHAAVQFSGWSAATPGSPFGCEADAGYTNSPTQVADDCFVEANAFIGGVAIWAGSKVSLIAIISATTPPAAPLTLATIALVTGTTALLGGAVAYARCVDRRRNGGSLQQAILTWPDRRNYDLPWTPSSGT